MGRATYVMLGGFLGAGKTTAVLALARHLTGRGKTVGLITNDQSFGLVDTALVESRGFPVEEITGGCFCCKFNSLVEASERLSASTRPDVFIAEPVGSCTDLQASVSYPLRRIYGDDVRLAPLSVLVDPRRAQRVLGLEEGRAFSSKVLYVYGKQLEEAELLVINKADLLSADRLAELQEALARRYPRARQYVVSARQGTGLEPWFDHILSHDLGTELPPEIDYEIYAAGEALLGWLNCTVRVAAVRAFDGNEALLDLGERIRTGLSARGLEIAHLKMTLHADGWGGGDLGVLNLVSTDLRPELPHALAAELETGELIVNLRAEGDPDALRQATEEALAAAGADRNLRLEVEHLEHFRPGKPEPTHRMASA